MPFFLLSCLFASFQRIPVCSCLFASFQCMPFVHVSLLQERDGAAAVKATDQSHVYGQSKRMVVIGIASDVGLSFVAVLFV